MPTYFPQINSNLIITQLPYVSSLSYESVTQDVASGMRYSFPRRAAGLTGYSENPLGSFSVSYSSITDAELSVLKAFFSAQRGRWGSFRFLDPAGNLFQYSEDFSQAYWDKSSGVSVGGAAFDPFGGTRATTLTASGAHMDGLIGASDGGTSGFVFNVSAWVKPQSDTTVYMQIGAVQKSWDVKAGRWKRIYCIALAPDNSALHGKIGGWSGALDVFGMQASPTKGEGAYVKSPGNYGYHENCRFDTDVFQYQASGPNQNSLNLPIMEINV